MESFSRDTTMFSSTFLQGNWLRLLLGLVITYGAYFIYKSIKIRQFYKDKPTPPHTMVLGNLKVMGESLKHYPADFHPQPMFTDMATEFNLRGLYYLDLYPFSQSMIMITDPAVALQTQVGSPDFARHPFNLQYLRGIAGTKGLFSTSGVEWQRQRSWFAPAFSFANLMSLVPGMIEESLVFKEKLTKYAVSGETFPMNEATLRLAIDFIGRSVGDIRLGSQTGYSPIQDAFQRTLDWTAGHTAPWWQKVLSPYMMDWYTAKLDKLLGEAIKDKYRSRKDDGLDKSILDLALKGYLKDNGRAGDSKSVRPDLDPEFMKMALDNAKTFFAGGHDTTAASMTYVIHYLSLHPKYLARVRAEHDSVFGSDFETTVERLTAEPQLLNKLTLTSAVIKECLRLHPVGMTVKLGAPGSTLTFEGRSYPTEGHMIAILTAAMHRDPTVWADPDKFDPDRFLSPETHSMDSWQPFEKGPRNCIGQQMATIEVRVMAALTIRFFDFEVVYKDHGSKLASIENWGGRGYQVLKMSAKPKDGLPMKAYLRSN